MIIGFIGGIGSGKTLTMTSYMHNDFIKGWNCYTNYGLAFKPSENSGNVIKLNKDFFQNYAKSGLNLVNSSIAIDEAHVFVDSRRSMSKKSLLFNKFITQSRKRNVMLYYTTQEISVDNFYLSGQVDLRLRKLTDFVIFCRFVKCGDNYYVLNDMYSMTQKLGTKIIHANPIFRMYDTNEIIDIDE